jgi:hypothetical protein
MALAHFIDSVSSDFLPELQAMALRFFFELLDEYRARPSAG